MPKISVNPKPILRKTSAYNKISDEVASRLMTANASGSSRNRFRVKVIPRAKKNVVECIAEGEYRVRLTAPPVDDKANSLLVKLLAKHFDVAPSSIRIVSGETSRQKIIEIL